MMADDLRASGLGDADAGRVADAMDSLGRWARRWPKVREVIEALPARAEPVYELAIDPVWLAKLKASWWHDNPDLKREANESLDAHVMRLRTWCLGQGLARISDEDEDEDEDEVAFRIPGEDDE